MSAKNPLSPPSSYERERHQIRKKAAGARRDESRKRMRTDQRMQSLQVVFSECVWEVHKDSSAANASEPLLISFKHQEII